MTKFYIASRNVLGLSTNGPELHWSFGVNVPEASKAEYEACAVRLRLEIGEQRDAPSTKASAERLRGKYHYFSGIPGEDAIRYSRKFMFGRDLDLRASGLLTDEPRISANNAYFRYIKHRFMNLHSVGYIMTDLACLLLLRHGYSPLHCSAIKKGNATAVIFAPPNTGKTLSAMMACMEYGAEFLAEDLAITNGSQLYSVPWTSTFRYYSRVEQSRFSRALNSATNLFPPLELLPLRKAKPIGDYVSQAQLVDDAPITHLIILERGPTAVRHEPFEEAYRKIVNLNRFEFNYVRSPLITAYEYFNPSLDIDAAVASERRILKDMLRSVPCVTVRADDATQYASMILDQLN